ncbi:MAG: chromate transporter, partial [Clostridia bacterium]
IQGVKPIVLVLLVGLVLDFLPGALPRQNRLFWVYAAFFVVGFISWRFLKVPAVFLVVAGMAGGAILLRG